MAEPYRVLLVEDDQAVRQALHYQLQSRGYHVDLAGDGRDGIEQALAVRPDAIMVDLGLLLVDGCEVARQVRSVYGDDVLLVAVTSSRSKEDRIRMMTAGFDIFLAKPVDSCVLRQALDPQPYFVAPPLPRGGQRRKFPSPVLATLRPAVVEPGPQDG